jgi:hypothetical protein
MNGAKRNVYKVIGGKARMEKKTTRKTKTSMGR